MEGKKKSPLFIKASSNFLHQTLDYLLLFSTKSKTPLQKPPLASSSAHQRRSSAGTWDWVACRTARSWRTRRAQTSRVWQGSYRKLWVLTHLLSSASSSLSSSSVARCDLLWAVHQSLLSLISISEILLKMPQRVRLSCLMPGGLHQKLHLMWEIFSCMNGGAFKS